MGGPRVAVWLAALLCAGCVDREGDGPGGGDTADPMGGGGKAPVAPGPETPREAFVSSPGGWEVGGPVSPGVGSASTDPATPGEEDPTSSWDPSWPVGRVYRLDLSGGDLVHPEGVEEVLLPFLAEAAQILVEPVEDHGDAVELLIAQARDDGGAVRQDLCKPTVTVTAAWDGTRIDIGPSQLVFSVDDVSGVIVDCSAAGEFSEDGSVLGSMSLEGGMDTRAFDCLADPDSCGTGALCGLLADAGSECGDCGDGGEWLCAYLRVEGLTAVREDALELRAVTPTEAVANRDAGACG